MHDGFTGQDDQYVHHEDGGYQMVVDDHDSPLGYKKRDGLAVDYGVFDGLCGHAMQDGQLRQENPGDTLAEEQDNFRYCFGLVIISLPEKYKPSWSRHSINELVHPSEDVHDVWPGSSVHEGSHSVQHDQDSVHTEMFNKVF